MSFEQDTMVHRARVSIALTNLGRELIKRGKMHDNSKFQTPEKELYHEYHDKLTDATFGTELYHLYLKKMQPAVSHHYQFNDHHPEHFEHGILDMDLIQMLEMLADISAVAEDKGTDVIEFLPTFMKEKNIPDIFYSILRNTLTHIVSLEH